MRIDEDYAFFAPHSDWYKFIDDMGYVPTETAPQEAVKAIEAYNARRIQRMFVYHNDWYRIVKKIWYTPTEKAPPQAIEAMADYNAYVFKTKIKDRGQKSCDKTREAHL